MLLKFSFQGQRDLPALFRVSMDLTLKASFPRDFFVSYLDSRSTGTGKVGCAWLSAMVPSAVRYRRAKTTESKGNPKLS